MTLTKIWLLIFLDGTAFVALGVLIASWLL